MINITRNTDNNGEPELTIKLNNGDLSAFDTVMQRWRFQTGVGLLRFVFAIMTKGRDNIVYVTDETGKQVAFEPADRLLTSSTSAEEGANVDAQQPPTSTAK